MTGKEATIDLDRQIGRVIQADWPCQLRPFSARLSTGCSRLASWPCLCGHSMLGKRASRFTEYRFQVGQLGPQLYSSRSGSDGRGIGRKWPRLTTQARMAMCNTGKDGHVYVTTSYDTGEDGHVQHRQRWPCVRYNVLRHRRGWPCVTQAKMAVCML
jgi:hypothetical protein